MGNCRFKVQGLLALGLATILILSGCGRREPRADVVIINGTDPESLDPAIITALEDYRIVPGLFEGLTRIDPVNAQAIPGLAERWDVDEGGRAYLFYFRPGLRWSTGDPLTAHDVVFSWLRLLDPRTAADYAAQLYCVKNGEAYSTNGITDASRVGIRAIDDLRLRVELNHPVPYFLDLCASPTLSVVPRKTIEALGDQWLQARPLPSSGSHTLEIWRLNDKIRFRKNPLYWDAANTANNTVEFLPVGSPATALNLYERGAADIIWDKDLVPAELLKDLKQRPDFHDFPYIGTYFVRFNTTRPPFHDARVRRALALAVDKRRIVERIIKGGESPAGHLVPTGVANHLAPESLGQDEAAARRLLSDAGFPQGEGFPVFEYLFDSAAGGGSKVHAKIGVELQEMWRRELGVRMELRQMEKKVYLAAQTGLDYDLPRSSWVGDYNDPNTFLDLFLSNNGNNRTGWKDERYDGLMRQANVEQNPRRRSELLRQAESILVAEEAVVIPLYFYRGFQFYDANRISGIHGNILGMNPVRTIRNSEATRTNGGVVHDRDARASAAAGAGKPQ